MKNPMKNLIRMTRVFAALGLALLFTGQAVLAQTATPAPKTRVKGYTRTLKGGKKITVRGYTRTPKMTPKVTAVKGYTKTLKSGKTVNVKGYTRAKSMKSMKKGGL